MPLDPQVRAVLEVYAALGPPPIGAVSAPEARIAMAARPLPEGAPATGVGSTALTCNVWHDSMPLTSKEDGSILGRAACSGRRDA